jgi:hypothetical protein
MKRLAHYPPVASSHLFIYSQQRALKHPQYIKDYDLPGYDSMQFCR